MPRRLVRGEVLAAAVEELLLGGSITRGAAHEGRDCLPPRSSGTPTTATSTTFGCSSDARASHHYFDIDLDVLWATVTQDLPQLLEALPTADELER